MTNPTADPPKRPRPTPDQPGTLRQQLIESSPALAPRQSALSAASLPELAEQINREHHAAESSAKSAIEHALECGRLLTEAKAQLKHGGWLAWLEGNCHVKKRQAQKYMALSGGWQTIESKSASNALLSIDESLHAIKQEERERRRDEKRAALSAAIHRSQACAPTTSDNETPNGGYSIYRNDIDGAWTVVHWPTKAGLRLQQLVDEQLATERYAKPQGVLKTARGRESELEAEYERLREQMRLVERRLQQAKAAVVRTRIKLEDRILADLEATHGPLVQSVHYRCYSVDLSTHDRLRSMPTDRVVDYLESYARLEGCGNGGTSYTPKSGYRIHEGALEAAS